VRHSAQIEKPQQRRDAAIAEPAAPRNFDPAYDRFGSKAENLDLSIRCPLYPRKRTGR
jgi:hypothetical protein